MGHLLDDCWLLIGRAEKQFDALHAEVREFFEANPAHLAIEDDDQTGEKVIYVRDEPIMPREWGADLGQLANNARSALDHLIYALAVKGGGQPDQARTAFPIFEKRDEYWKVRGRGTRAMTVRDQYLVGVPEPWREKVDAVQPYRHGDRAYLDPLAVLNDVANSSKHKTLKAARFVIETPGHFCDAVGGLAGLVVRYDPRRPDDVRVEAQMKDLNSVIPHGLGVHPKVQVDGRTGLGLHFGVPPRAVTLGQAKRAVSWSRSVIKWFEPAFDPPVET